MDDNETKEKPIEYNNDNNEKSLENHTKSDMNYITMKSPIYMIIFWLVGILVIVSMTLQLIVNLNENILETMKGNFVIPYSILINSLTAYMAILSGVEGTRSILKSKTNIESDLYDPENKEEYKDAENISDSILYMPKYKRNRILAMLTYFLITSILAVIYQMISINIGSSFCIGELFIGVAIGMLSLTYSDLGPKMIKDFIVDKFFKNIYK